MRSLEYLNGLKIPVITTYTPSELAARVHEPTPTNPQGDILEQLRDLHRRGVQPHIQTQHHALYALNSLLPHSQGEKNTVLWVANKTSDGRDLLPWQIHNFQGWRDLASDGEFLSGIEELGRYAVARGESFFFMFGFSFNNLYLPQGVAPRGAMSQVASHFHHTSGHTREQIDSYVQLSQNELSTDPYIFPLFFDFGSQVARDELKRRMRDFSSHRIDWTLHEGRVPRHGEGFLNLYDAIRQLVRLGSDLEHTWPRFVENLAKEQRDKFMFPYVDDPQSLLLLPPVVTASAFFPSQADKANMGLPPDDPCTVWVSPFSLIQKQPLVDGIWTRRVKTF